MTLLMEVLIKYWFNSLERLQLALTLLMEVLIKYWFNSLKRSWLALTLLMEVLIKYWSNSLEKLQLALTLLMKVLIKYWFNSLERLRLACHGHRNWWLKFNSLVTSYIWVLLKLQTENNIWEICILFLLQINKSCMCLICVMICKNLQQLYRMFYLLMHYDEQIHGLMQDCSNSIANALELLQSCTKSSIWCGETTYMCWSIWHVTVTCHGMFSWC